jgi:outer membrane protein assembly factor BamB
VIVITGVDEFTYHLDCFDTKGNLIWQKRNLNNPVFLSGNGRYAVSGPLNMAIETMPVYILYDVKNGKELWRKERETGKGGTENLFTMVHILHNGKVLLLDGVKLELIDTNGNKLWEYKLSHSDVYVVSTDFEENNRIALINNFGYNGACVFDEGGNLLWQVPKIDNVTLWFSKDGNYLYIFGRKGRIDFLYKMDMNGKIIWERELGDTIYNTLNISSDDKYLLLCGDPAFRPREYLKRDLLLLDAQSGEVVKRVQRETDIYGEFLKNSLLIKEGNKLILFDIKEDK